MVAARMAAGQSEERQLPGAPRPPQLLGPLSLEQLQDQHPGLLAQLAALDAAACTGMGAGSILSDLQRRNAWAVAALAPLAPANAHGCGQHDRRSSGATEAPSPQTVLGFVCCYTNSMVLHVARLAVAHAARRAGVATSLMQVHARPSTA